MRQAFKFTPELKHGVGKMKLDNPSDASAGNGRVAGANKAEYTLGKEHNRQGREGMQAVEELGQIGERLFRKDGAFDKIAGKLPAQSWATWIQLFAVMALPLITMAITALSGGGMVDNFLKGTETWLDPDLKDAMRMMLWGLLAMGSVSLEGIQLSWMLIDHEKSATPGQIAIINEAQGIGFFLLLGLAVLDILNLLLGGLWLSVIQSIYFIACSGYAAWTGKKYREASLHREVNSKRNVAYITNLMNLISGITDATELETGKIMFTIEGKKLVFDRLTRLRKNHINDKSAIEKLDAVAAKDAAKSMADIVDSLTEKKKPRPRVDELNRARKVRVPKQAGYMRKTKAKKCALCGSNNSNRQMRICTGCEATINTERTEKALSKLKVGDCLFCEDKIADGARADCCNCGSSKCKREQTRLKKLVRT